MKLCIPTVDEGGLRGRISDHFGRAGYFTLVDSESASVEIVVNENAEHEHGQCGGWTTLLAAMPEVVVCRGVGRNAHARLAEQGVAVFRTDAVDVGEALEAFRSGALKRLTMGECQQHEHGHGHGQVHIGPRRV